jgi:hypothetical protein
MDASPLATATPALTRDADHKYWLVAPPKTNENLLGVTEVMVDLGFESDEWFTETHSSRGVAVHADLAAAAAGKEINPFIDPDLYGWRLSGLNYLAYLLADGAVVLGVEKMLHSPLYRFAGTIDLVVLWRGYEWVLDWKTGKASKVTRFKLAAYDTLLGPAANGKQRKRAAIEVQEDGGRARLVEYNAVENFHDANRFLGYLSTTRDRRAFAVKQKPLKNFIDA